MWLDDMDIGGRGIYRPAVGPLGWALRGARQQQFLSQESLAKAAGVSQTQVSKLELGAPNWRLFCRLLKTLGGEPIVTVQPLDPKLDALKRLAANAWLR